ncbi:TerD family protein, partial [Bacillus altitudinis]|uniref:TerD family protein n=1 Tax=Bacillus altitudinis TaxID=293387 RepID=UPI002356A26A
MKRKWGSVEERGEKVTGEGEGDDEEVVVKLRKVGGNVNKLVLVVKIYDGVRRKQDFGMIENGYIGIVDGSKN